MNGTKAKDEYGQTVTIQSITDNVVKVYERPNDTVHISKLFVNGIALDNLAWSETLGRYVTIPQE